MVRYDIVIAGGGPAGSLAAVLLARQGARVALVDAGAGRPRLEGLPPRAATLLDGLGLGAGEIGPAVARRARWGGLEGAPNREHLVERAAFDAALRRGAADAGASLVVGRIAGLAPAAGGLLLKDGSALQAGLLVEARGRRAPAAAGRKRGPASVAIAGRAGRAAGAGAEIVAARDGWCWRAAEAEGPAWTQIVVDAAALRPGPAGVAAAWRGFFAHGDLARSGLDGGGPPPPAAPLVRAAELRLAAPELDPRLPRLGDAAVAFDPLSGHGLFWALSSALAAPALCRALLEGEAELARRFHRDRVAETFWRQARIGRDFHRLAGGAGDFWRARAAWPDAAPVHAPLAAPRLRRQVVVRDGRLAEAEALVTARDPGGVAFVRGREIAPILRRLGASGLPDRQAFCRRVLPEAPPEEAGAIHDWLVHRGLGAPGALSLATTMEAA